MIALVGDIHGSVEALQAVRVAHPDVTAIVQVGDFGLRPQMVPDLGIPLYFMEGNHEHWPFLYPYQKIADMSRDAGKKLVPMEYAKNCWYVPRGCWLTLEGTRYFCAGGADSVDKAWQVRQGVWSPRESWTPEEAGAILTGGTPDVFLFHGPPQGVIDRHFDPRVLTDFFGLPATWRSPVAEYIEQLCQMHPAVPVYCGHMHRSVTDGPVRILAIGEVVLR